MNPCPAHINDQMILNHAVTTSLLPSHARRILENCPTAGSGVHHWIFLAALTLGDC